MKKSIACLIFLCASIPVHSQSSLSQNSGINSSDTWVAFDMTIQRQTSITTSQQYYNPVTQTTSNTFTSASSRTFHAETGYDSAGGLVLNMWPTGTQQPANSAISAIRFAAGQVTVFDTTGTPIPVQLPNANIKQFNLSNLLGANPGPSVINTLVTANIQTFATKMNATIINSYFSPGGVPLRDVSIPAMGQQTAASVWTFESSGSNWVITQMVSHPKVSNGTGTQTISFANVTWSDNASNDSARAAKGNTSQTPPAPTNLTPSGPSSITNPNPTIVNHLGGSQNVVFQHGLLSDSSTWGRMITWLNGDFLFGTEIIPSLKSLDPLASQSTALENEITSVGGNQYILIGHSQGGLISRSAAQSFQNLNPPPNPAVALGVVTVDTPNKGADAALASFGLVAGLIDVGAFQLISDLGCLTPDDNFGCFLGVVVAEASGPMADYALTQVVPPNATFDLIPGSAFLSNLNSQTENFTRTGVVSFTSERWVFTRIADNALDSALGVNCNPEDLCGERAIATGTEAFYDFIFALALEAEFNGDCYDADSYFQILDDMDLIDGIWNVVVDPFAVGSDGIVQADSQNYPSTTANQFSILGADSHLGSTRSNIMRSALDFVLKNEFHVPTPADCAFTLSPSNFAVSSGGGTGSFSFTTLTGCHWSAVSKVGWLSVTSASTGTSSGSVSFSIADNPAMTPRTGTITLGNGAASSTFTVQQAGLCTYLLSTDTIAIPAGGGTSGASVLTQSGCAWSAVSNAPWITITAGATGTGPGSFLFSAGANTGTASLIGTITIMDQTLTVVLGSPMGTPGSGGIAISGFARFKLVCAPGCATCSFFGSCQGTQVDESGSVTVTIAGDSFTASYSGNESGSQLASDLASQINSSSLVSASASGSGITITSRINGANTNYSVGTSYTFDTRFSGPAFTAVASGSSLTGGTD